MKIVLDVSKADYRLWAYDEWGLPLDLVDTLQNGKILPETHGRLLDESVVISALEEKKRNWRSPTIGVGFTGWILRRTL